MGDFEKLLEAAKPFCERIKAVAESDAETCIISHIDADGITSGSIIALALSRLKAKFCLRCVSDMNDSLLQSLKNENHDFVIVSDLGAGWLNPIKKTFGDNCVILDHHQLPSEEAVTDDSNQLFNAWKFDIDGGRDISAGGMTYVVAYGLDAK